MYSWKPLPDNMFEVYNNIIFQMNVLIHFERFVCFYIWTSSE